MKKRGHALIITVIILLVVAVFLSWFIYQNLPGSPEQLNAIFKQPELETANLSHAVKQFYPNMKFNHNSISYTIDSQCDEEKRERMIKAFIELSSMVEVISFYESQGEQRADIEVTCSKKAEKLKEETKKGFFIAGEGGAKEIIQTGRYNVITDGVILLYSFPHKAIECEWPNIELHELVHVFGFGHSEDKNSLMYPTLESCNQKLDEAILQNIKDLHSQENLADLYFEHVDATKRGRYLDFNVTVKNSGTIDAGSVILTVTDDGEEIEDFDLKDIPFGGGLTFQVGNLKLKSRASENIDLVIDLTNSISELDEDNNIAKLSFT